MGSSNYKDLLKGYDQKEAVAFLYSSRKTAYMLADMIALNDIETLDWLIYSCLGSNTKKFYVHQFYYDFISLCCSRDNTELLFKYFPLLDKRYLDYNAIVRKLSALSIRLESTDLFRKLYYFIPFNVFDKDYLIKVIDDLENNIKFRKDRYLELANKLDKNKTS